MSRSTQPSTPAPAHETYLESLLQELRTREGSQGNLIGASIGSALEAIRANRTRSLLTMLGIVIGITAVIGALTLTKGVGAYIDNVLLGQGANTIYVAPSHSLVQQGGTTVSQEGQPLTVHDLQSLSNLPHVAAISPIIKAGGQVAEWQSSLEQASFDGSEIGDRIFAKAPLLSARFLPKL